MAEASETSGPNRVRLIVRGAFAHKLAGVVAKNDVLVVHPVPAVAIVPLEAGGGGPSGGPGNQHRNLALCISDDEPEKRVLDVVMDVLLAGRENLVIKVTRGKLNELDSQAALMRSVLANDEVETGGVSASGKRRLAGDGGGTGSATGVKRRKVMTRSYRYTPLVEVAVGMEAHVYGVVVALREPRQTRGSDMMMSLTLRDDSNSDAELSSLRINVFAPPGALPPIAGVGDVVRIHRLDIQLFRGFRQGCSRKRTSFAVFDKALGTPIEPRTHPTLTIKHTLNDADRARVRELRGWYEALCTVTALPRELAPLAPAKHAAGSCPRVMLGNVKPDGGAVCLVVRLASVDLEAQTGLGWDGSPPPGQTRLLDARPLGAGFLSRWSFDPLPAQRLILSEQTRRCLGAMGAEAGTDSWVELHECRLGSAGEMLVDGPAYSVEPSSTAASTSRFLLCPEPGVWQCKAAPSATNRTRPVVSLRSVLERARSEHVKARVLARVVEITPGPRQVEAACVPLCPACGGLVERASPGSSGTYACAACDIATLAKPQHTYMFVLRLVDASAVADVIAFDDDALALFPGLPATDLTESNVTRDGVRERMTGFLADGAYLDLCVCSYADGDGHIRFRIFGTQGIVG
ncbi:uncharacterized protein AMSG_02940 [Thecamonas trahens ATCC 50062]|uniref:Telomeric single stranded DNA binding POT1/Cdc13 domain-containing protein n=1 Tax=Thecamonas trahens ATCC 50062 TaxID=461836 RepID=A0A0L0D2U8_THETB|nr:hypothetical protein AMSG_02940 [Thecamonas trahens ATCC 50062]KNC46505.1 hypothetical protein AMSG_02940 [Thecamonas trahens ATCC 50062]|eukprot:XP_013760286.1 hypothetical protein AMSG_02940 [Thecamonas trahens ATCC 50062]